MNSRERLQKAINHEAPDKVPVDFGSAPVTSIHCSCVADLREYYGLEKKLITVYEPFQMLGWLDEDLIEVLGIDTVGISPRGTLFGVPNGDWKEFRTPWGQEVLISGHLEIEEGENGDFFVYPQGDRSVPPSGHMPKAGYYFDLITRQKGKIDPKTLDPADNLAEFEELSEEDLDYFEDQVQQALKTGRGIMANFGIIPFVDVGLIQGPTIKYPKGIRSLTDWLIATVKQQDYLHEVFTRQSDIALINLAKVYERVGNNIDVMYLCGYDFGTQTSTFCSPKTFDELFAPYYKKVTGWIHENTTWKTFKHTDGAIEPFISKFIDVGIDILNPVQWTASNMDPQHIKSTYGHDIAFWGAGVDTQKTLPYGTPEQVRTQVLEMCEIFAQGGGYIFNSVHNLLPQSPVENLVAMFDAVKEFNGDL
ncbi:MAG: uroporphyrinogen decarboxylase family protein [Candidatus Promineifilaceae bacterium]|nr:uroporphyrinogen decarboxylase family protein [Candidatus Promineifilaceae bacterium]